MNSRVIEGKQQLLVSCLPPNANAGAVIEVVEPVAMTRVTTINMTKGFAHSGSVTKDGRMVISVPTGAATAPLGIDIIELSGQVNPAVKAVTNTQSNNGYVGVTPNGKHLVVSSHHPNQHGGGMDVYETSTDSMGEKKISSMKKAGDLPVGGTFLISPESDFVVFNTGAVLKLDELGTTGSGDGGNPFPPPPGGGIGVPPGGNPFPPPPGGGMGAPGFPPHPVVTERKNLRGFSPRTSRTAEHFRDVGDVT
jgi:hypothetical protein